MKRGFTIVEMLVVIAIIGVLLGIVTTAAASSIRQARSNKADACCKIVKQAFATYYAQEGRWPGGIGERISDGTIIKGNIDGEPENYELTPAEVKEMMMDILKAVKKGNPLMDISGLYVSRKGDAPQELSCKHSVGQKKRRTTYRPAKGAVGLDFWDAVHGRKKDSPNRMSTSQMYFGYPNVDGGFMPFRVVYSIPTDEMKVLKWHSCK